MPLWDSVSLFLTCLQVPKWVILAPSWFHLITNYMLVFFFLLLAEFVPKKSIAHESIIHAHYYRWISFSLCCSPPPPAASVSNLKSTMSPHSSILNTYPSNLQAAPITRICHGTHGLLLLDRSRGRPRRGQRANMGDQVLDCSRG